MLDYVRMETCSIVALLARTLPTLQHCNDICTICALPGGDLKQTGRPRFEKTAFQFSVKQLSFSLSKIGTTTCSQMVAEVQSTLDENRLL